VLIKQLAYENAKTDCKKALVPIKETGSVSEFIRICQFVGMQEHQQGVFAVTLKQALHPSNDGCFKCGKRGHIQREGKFSHTQTSSPSYGYFASWVP
jgi:hypothetical protein